MRTRKISDKGEISKSSSSTARRRRQQTSTMRATRSFRLTAHYFANGSWFSLSAPPIAGEATGRRRCGHFGGSGDNTLSLQYHIRAPVDVHDFLCPKTAWVLSRNESRRKIYAFHCAATGDYRSCGSSRYFSARAGRWHMDRCQ